MSMVFQGRGVSEGMAMGAVFLLAQQTLKAPDTPARDPETEVEQFEAAMARTRRVCKTCMTRPAASWEKRRRRFLTPT